MKMTVKDMRKMIAEATSSMSWNDWYDELLDVRGFDSVEEYPLFSFITPYSEAHEQIDDAARAMFEKGLTPQQAHDEYLEAATAEDLVMKWLGEELGDTGEEDEEYDDDDL